MKEKIIMFVIGVLVGAVISTGAFYIYTRSNTNNQNTQMSGGTPSSMPNGQPPEKPSGDSNQNGEPPEMPNSTTQSNN